MPVEKCQISENDQISYVGRGYVHYRRWNGHLYRVNEDTTQNVYKRTAY